VLRDPEVRAIFALTGGRLALSYLDLVDYATVEVDPKPVLGFSDISALHLAIHVRTGLVSLHANLVTYGFGEWGDLGEHHHTQLVDLYRRILTEDRAPGPLPSIGEWECWRPGSVTGPLIGGLLNRLIRLQATQFAVALDRFDGAILFWEELSSTSAALWNDLHILRQAGILDRIAGMIDGIPTAIDPTEGGPATVREVVLDVLGQREIPVLGNFDIGHSATNVPMPLGVRAELDADGRTVSLAEAVVTAS
jgi:muramoyltetrapeptide carboxypeptidase